MFSFFSKSDKQQIPIDKVWQSRAACFKGMQEEAQIALRNGRTPIVLSFFEETRQKFIENLDSNSIAHASLESDKRPEPTRKCQMLIVTTVSAVDASAFDWLTKQAKVAELSILMIGHYPVLLPEQEFLEKLHQRLGKVSVVFGVSFDDPLMKHFGSDRIKILMESLGLGQNECVEHAMVSKAIHSARKKIDEKIKSEIKTKSESEWFAKNFISLS